MFPSQRLWDNMKTFETPFYAPQSDILHSCHEHEQYQNGCKDCLWHRTTGHCSYLKLQRRELAKLREGTHCIADRFWNYVQKLCKDFDLYENQDFMAKLKDVYMDLRVEGAFIDKNPITIAAAYFWIACLHYFRNDRLTARSTFTQVNIAPCLGISPVAIRHQYTFLEKFSEKHNINWEKLNPNASLPSLSQ